MALITRLGRHARLPLRPCTLTTRTLIRYNSSQNQEPKPGKSSLELSPITSISDGLKKYVRWYPYDTVTYSTIQTYLGLRRNTSRSETILVGLLYESDEVRKTSRVIESLLADPLSSNNQEWYIPLTQRSREKNNLLSFKSPDPNQFTLPGAFERTVAKYDVPSPILSPELRRTYPEIFEASTSAPNGLSILEINRESDVHKLTDNCQFFIYVTSEFSTLMDNLPRHVQKKIMLTIIDNKEFSPSSAESTPVTFERSNNVTHHSIKINSKQAYEGIQLFLKEDTKAATEYFDSLQRSNIIEIGKFMSWYLRTENLTSWMFHVICTEIARNSLSETRIRQIYDDLKLNSLVECSASMHTELQKDLIPRTNNFFDRKLRWYMLYWKNDNVEYWLKDFFQGNFMPKSIESYNYVRGQLTARLQEQKFAAYSDKIGVINPLKGFKRKLVNERIANEIQPVVYSCLALGFVYYQLPLTALSVLGYLFVGLQANTAFAIGLLGWVLGFNHVSREWDKFTKEWRKDLFEEVRLTISKGCVDDGLLKELDSRFEESRMLALIKQQVLEALQKYKEK
ncbi:hypothetical protein FT663_02602 [Candidozyma haemuli var. vulneris]|uniref:Mmc1 C-terminal domain-containing protein n=1 Tax=Candidozyma haemuli TaxID=45357 RepID=A0A2V1AZL8_9ASCO|nr:hypothetical protein CXQ85_002681 [[Candida] haemuloni]KAF3991729.1 hypothetical protein FT663_02602 [[Candida] haemuloni var. vulneris]KAF3992074.1 hypothetical protein FT662_01383 [[Candida] haemuloni var. vulneris]PVH22956.1 hypothetical protein CXQ85_002681 [[Candida] haemuloni]